MDEAAERARNGRRGSTATELEFARRRAMREIVKLFATELEFTRRRAM
jgi:hypothetical protein